MRKVLLPALSFLVGLGEIQASPDTVLPVQPASAWSIHQNPPGNAHLDSVQNVTTPAGPGIQTKATGNTIDFCENSFARRTFTLPQAPPSHNSALSFYYQAAQTGSFVTTSMHLRFSLLGVQVGQLQAIRALDPPRRNGSDPTGTPVTHVANGAVATLSLEALLGQVQFDAVEVTLNHYGCVMTGTRIPSYRPT